MKTLMIAGVIAATGLAASGASIASTTMSTQPAQGWTVTNYYKQSVYDPKETKLGAIDDVLIDRGGKITGLVVGVGGFLGVGEKDVIVPFDAVKSVNKDGKTWLALNETKQELTSAQGFKYDSDKKTWIPAKK